MHLEMPLGMRLGATPLKTSSGSNQDPQSTYFLVWAPIYQKVSVWLSPEGNSWIPDVREPSVQSLTEILNEKGWRCVPLNLTDGGGYWEQTIPKVPLGTLYLYELQTESASLIRPDPGSYSQPYNVHGPSEVISLDFPWEDHQWKGTSWDKLVIYQAHPALFSTDLSLTGIIPRIEHLKSLSSTLGLYLLPIMEFAGEYNLGYDGAYPWAVHHSLGGVEAAQKLVNALHKNGLAAIFDMHVHNHFGPEGSYIWNYGPHFTDVYNTPWGAAKNYDQPGAEGARRHIIEAVRFYFEILHADGIRMDACHAVFDSSEKHILKELQEEVARLEEKLQRPLFLLAELDTDDPCLITPRESGGYGWRGQLYDGLHHASLAYFHPELGGYFTDYLWEKPKYPVHRIAEVLRNGYGEHYSKFLDTQVGKDIPSSVPVNSLVMPLSNVDQVANYCGLRLNQRLSFEAYKAIAALALLLPGPPFFLSGDEIYSQDPIFFFCNHSDPAVIKATRKGRLEEFGYFYSDLSQFPDPQDKRTFLKSRQHLDICTPKQRAVLGLFKKCLALRKQFPAIPITDRAAQSVAEFSGKSLLQYDRVHEGQRVRLLLNLGNDVETVHTAYPMYRLLDTRSTQWGGSATAEQSDLHSTIVGPESLVLLVGDSGWRF